MNANERTKEIIRAHKSKVEIFQWAVTSSVASLIYSEYIRNMRQKAIPVRHVEVPMIRHVEDMIAPDNSMMLYLSDHLIDDLLKDELMQKYVEAPELILFNDDCLDGWKTIFDLYVIPNISKTIPATITKKFGLDDEKQQLFRQSRELSLFNHKPIAGDRYQYLVHQTALQLLMLIPSVEKITTTPENNTELFITETSILTISHPNAICPIHLDANTMDFEKSMELIEYVTSTSAYYIGGGDIVAEVDGEVAQYRVRTGPFNQTKSTKLGKILYLTKTEEGAQ